MFIAICSSFLWVTISFVVHQLNSSSSPQDESHHQLQLILRNTDNTGTCTNQLSKLAWVHKRSKSKTYYKSIGLLLFANIFNFGFILVGIFSTKFIAAQDSSVLSVSRHCGWFKEPTVKGDDPFDFDSFYTLSGLEFAEYVNAVSVMSRNVLRRSAAYSRSCYGRFGENSTACGNYAQATLAYTITRDVGCPFNDKACNGTAISLDTGHIRSDSDLGINTTPEDALSMRKVLTCVPLAGESYTSGWQQLPDEAAFRDQVPQGTRAKAYSFGPYLGYSQVPAISNYTIYMDEVDWKKGQQPYSLL